jgi:hypothetical protein
MLSAVRCSGSTSISLGAPLVVEEFAEFSLGLPSEVGAAGGGWLFGLEPQPTITPSSKILPTRTEMASSEFSTSTIEGAGNVTCLAQRRGCEQR